MHRTLSCWCSWGNFLTMTPLSPLKLRLLRRDVVILNKSNQVKSYGTNALLYLFLIMTPSSVPDQQINTYGYFLDSYYWDGRSMKNFRNKIHVRDSSHLQGLCHSVRVGLVESSVSSMPSLPLWMPPMSMARTVTMPMY